MKNLFLLTTIILLFSNCATISGGDCEPFGEWEFERTECEPNFWCFFKAQQATYDYFIRQKQCRNGIVEQRRRTKRNCGC